MLIYRKSACMAQGTDGENISKRLAFDLLFCYNAYRVSLACAELFCCMVTKEALSRKGLRLPLFVRAGKTHAFLPKILPTLAEMSGYRVRNALLGRRI